ncbi:MAG TPA: HD domain-containing phosphohydrolase [Geobacteraceae bacterium]|nr:HD domain-containing phosphohydrolase [Geobacteraceae bacterium]
MSQELCEMSLQQTQELLRLTDETLQNICCKKFTGEKLYAEAVQKVLGGRGKRGPASIFIVFRENDGEVSRGRLFHLKDGELVERSDEVSIDPKSSYAIKLDRADVMASNWADSCRDVEDYQSYFQPELREKVGEAIRNFAACHISGETPGVILAFNYPGKATVYDGDVLRSLAVVIGSLVTISKELQETEKAFIYTIEALARACEAAEEHTGKHILRVNRYAGALAANMGLPDDFVDLISYSAQMHDVGKIKVPISILLKDGPLDREEMTLMMMHPVYGEKILGDSPRLRTAREIALAHHENWDGSGYPNGLAGEEIPVAGRIVKIADVYDALRSKRSYKGPLSHAAALGVFREGDERIIPGAHFDPAILKTFFQIEHIFAKIYESSEDTLQDDWIR